MADEINPRTGQCYYAGSKSNIVAMCRQLNIDDTRLSNINSNTIYNFMDLVESSIDGYLEEYYFVPIRPYNVRMPDGHIEKQFPGKLRRLAIYWTAGLLLLSENQQVSSNVNETTNNYIEDARKELHQMVIYNQRIAGQRYKSGFSRTMPPTMQPNLPPEPMW